jgi:hypothetical protein
MKAFCQCQRCGGGIEFDSKDSGCSTICPHCSSETTVVFVSQPDIIYSDGNVIVSATRLTVGGSTYPIAAITSIRVIRILANRSALHFCYAMTLAFFVFGIALMTDQDSRAVAIVCLSLSISGVFLAGLVWRKMKDTFALAVTTSAQEQQVLHSKSVDGLLPVQAALHQAISIRG